VNAVTHRLIRTLVLVAQRVGPYLLLEILLPGGTFFAFMLYLSRRPADVDGDEEASAGFFGRVGEGLHETLDLVAGPLGIVPAWRGRKREHDGLEALAIAPAL
jgi:hypothetical protein